MSLIDRFFNPSSQDKDWRGIALILFFAFVLPALWALYDNIKDILARRSRKKAFYECLKKQKAEEIRRLTREEAREEAAELLRDAENQKKWAEEQKEVRKKVLILIDIICSNGENIHERFAAWNILKISVKYNEPTDVPGLYGDYPLTTQDLNTICYSATDEIIRNKAMSLQQEYHIQMRKFKAHERIIGKLS